MADERSELGQRTANLLKKLKPDLLTARRLTLQEQNNTKKGEKPWDAYGGTSESYDNSFIGLKVPPFKKYVSDLSRFRGRVVGLDLMSDTAFLRDLHDSGLTGGTAVGLYDTRNEESRILDGSFNLELIVGSLLYKSTWRKIPDGFDFAVCRGVGGVDKLPRDSDLLYFLLNSLWQKVTANNGIIILQVPKFISIRQLQRFQDLNRMNGIEMVCSEAPYKKESKQGEFIPPEIYANTFPSMKIVKAKSSPNNLPVMNFDLS